MSEDVRLREEQEERECRNGKRREDINPKEDARGAFHSPVLPVAADRAEERRMPAQEPPVLVRRAQQECERQRLREEYHDKYGRHPLVHAEEYIADRLAVPVRQNSNGIGMPDRRLISGGCSRRQTAPKRPPFPGDFQLLFRG